MKIVILPKNEDEMHLWESKGQTVLSELNSEINSFHDVPTKRKLKESEYGAGASWPSIILEIIEISGIILIGIPALHKKIRETLSEWKEIKANVDKLLCWLSSEKRVSNKSIDIAFLHVLEHLSKKTNVLELEPIEAEEILGLSGFIDPSFENAEIVYYSFKFRKDNEKLFSVICDGELNIHSDVELHLDPYQRFLEK